MKIELKMMFRNGEPFWYVSYKYVDWKYREYTNAIGQVRALVSDASGWDYVVRTPSS